MAGAKVTIEWNIDIKYEEITLKKNGVPFATGLNSSGVLSDYATQGVFPHYEIIAQGPSELMSESASVGSEPIEAPIYESVAIIGLTSSNEPGASESVAVATPNASSTTLRYMTFIPNAYVAAPSVGCTYSGDFDYYFKGDNRTYSSVATTYRTKFDVLVNWGNQSVTSTRTVGSTKVYQLANGVYSLKSTDTASSSAMKLTPTSASLTQAKFNMRQDVANPFCSSNGIYFDLDVTVNRSGNYSIIGDRLQVPSHEIYIKDSDVTAWKTILRDASLYFPECLTPIVSTALGCLEQTQKSGTRG